jgi:hypothetical protein
LRADVLDAELNGRPAPFQIIANKEDQHVSVKLQLQTGENVLHIRIKNDFGLSVPYQVPALGSTSRNLRVDSETWSATRDALSVDLEGIAGDSYDLGVSDASQILSIEGGQLVNTGDGHATLHIQFPGHSPDTVAYTSGHVVIHFVGKSAATGKK